MIVLLGSSGYVGQAVANCLDRHGVAWQSLSRREVDYYHPAQVAKALRERGRPFLSNCAGFTGKPNVDACERQKAETLEGNAVLPGRLMEACRQAAIPWGHVSSGCIFLGEREGGGGFRETDRPNFSFRSNHCSFYSGAKAHWRRGLGGCRRLLHLASENSLQPCRFAPQLPEQTHDLPASPGCDHSLSHLDEFAEVCLQCWLRRCPFGIYNVVNTGAVTTRQVVEMIRRRLLPHREFAFFANEAEFMATAAQNPARIVCLITRRFAPPAFRFGRSKRRSTTRCNRGKVLCRDDGHPRHLAFTMIQRPHWWSTVKSWRGPGRAIVAAQTR